MTQQGNGRGPRRAARPGDAITAMATGCALALALSLAACKPRAPARIAVPSAQAGAEGTPYRIDADASQLRFYLHADGALARVGHSHVISARAIDGKVWLQSPPERSACELRLPVAAFVVDDPQERAAAGGGFAEPLTAADRDGTRVHMLGERQLDAARFPAITLRCLRLATAPGGDTIDVEVMLRDHATRLSVPLHWELHDDTLRASGELTFRQSELGLEPYSLLLGALRVADPVLARFELVARRAETTPGG